MLVGLIPEYTSVLFNFKGCVLVGFRLDPRVCQCERKERWSREKQKAFDKHPYMIHITNSKELLLRCAEMCFACVL